MEDLKHLGYKYAGPVLVAYVRWILKNAVQFEIKRLYFLARDGYTLKLIAEMICEKFGLDIECRYLYCSRASLRMPTYHFIGDKAYKLISIGATRQTINTIFDRVQFSSEEKEKVLTEAHLENSDALLNDFDFKKMCNVIFQTESFKKILNEKSQSAYSNAIGYLRQEGLLDNIKYAIADSGWTGSMQRSLRQLLESVGYKERLCGFYFGMFAKPVDAADGDYHTFYFNAEHGKLDKIFFCNNLFECWLSAPHGMTLEYKEKNGRFSPVMLPAPSEKEAHMIAEQISGIMEYTASLSDKELRIDSFDVKNVMRETRKKLRHIMSRPTLSEAECFGSFAFCDDSTEGYHRPLASNSQTEQLKSYSLIKRIYRKLSHRSAEYVPANLFWAYGTMAFEKPLQKVWYRLNYIVWEWLRFTLK